MRLVVEEDKYLKVEKAKHSWFSNFLFNFVFFCFAVVSVGKNAQTQLGSSSAFNVKNSAVLRSASRTLCVHVLVEI
jgi:hypothetical protein